ncbi:Rv0361 family membrane protein [Cohnella herbarum]|uniref:DUF4878 domain-containing protein n=1 Tax=Cohnella herbarum TaxID=2728023 RepID=A0A7Z2VPC5_9BACL|nr:DUF4878 domain-containing protein [Cohnella herbarum]QJD86687.1 DUF4878 domain-containing protein [Cohnella herbarum]
MYCVNCGEKLVQSAISCPSCGSVVRQAYDIPEGMAAKEETPEQQSWVTQPETRSYGLSDQSKKLILVGMGAIAIVFLIFRFAGGAGSQATPEKTVKGFLSAVMKEDAKEMTSYLSITYEDFPNVSDKDSFIAMQEEQFKSGGMDLQDYEIMDVKINEDKATVDYEIEYVVNGMKQTQEDSFNLVKTKRKWYIFIDLNL